MSASPQEIRKEPFQLPQEVSSAPSKKWQIVAIAVGAVMIGGASLGVLGLLQTYGVLQLPSWLSSCIGTIGNTPHSWGLWALSGSSLFGLFLIGYGIFRIVKPKKSEGCGPWWVVNLLCLPVSTHVLRGLCKMTGYEALEHGTTWCSYVSILRNGADPSRGGEVTEKTRPRAETGCPNNFYVTKDEDFGNADTKYVEREKLPASIIPFYRRGKPFYHSYLAYKSKFMGESESAPIWAKVPAFVISLFTPRVRFVYSNNETKSSTFKTDDRDWDGAAYMTEESLPADRIGFVGLLRHLDKEHVVEHIKKRRSRVVAGVIQLSAGIILTGSGLGLFF